ncbi:FMN-binding negative transcriptional regulator [Janthinobacterium agaricidamnosum]|uniref:Putative FMN-binding domain protein n=1 Tax=Janthinobacterium agaricidamnosum NBRC 102515 = DSM 9628 TaxID=1349767 RepID=W0VDE8_9BURK|nr:FMN-binding negative transcriptional regulator [Janthinobacterium agaricidamnosum]CDG85408.1 putative FMN-binding domain protein [Janthinobacterium agaricidamnosum NBRC 102515 = DSM 9628]
MYTPSHFNETRLDVLHALIAAHPLGALVRLDGGELCADHVPFDIAAPTPDAPFGTLRAHVARANPLWRAAAPAMVLFQGPQAYISPAWYEEKARSGKVVPTFNYAVVHAHGTLRAIHDPEWLLALLERLTDRHEARQAAPWRVADAPPDYIARMLAAIVGIEIPLRRIDGKWKASQNRSQADRSGIAAGLAAGEPPMSALMQKYF